MFFKKSKEKRFKKEIDIDIQDSLSMLSEDFSKDDFWYKNIVRSIKDDLVRDLSREVRRELRDEVILELKSELEKNLNRGELLKEVSIRAKELMADYMYELDTDFIKETVDGSIKSKFKEFVNKVY